ncbi:phage minor tail protein L [Agarilytica rhodophyticola]|uniref:phage minor tail protein L n=1 Tax=Agarilytica rhodophyticola TaxID=1737490 RepID=UPI00131A3BF3|nr:phage minor tail protein L [Agarilytica rhodophyticola]
MPDIIASTAQQSYYGAVVTLFVLDASSIGGSITYFTPGPLNGEFVQFNNRAYVPFPAEINGLSWSGRGAIPTPSLTVSNVGSDFVAAILGSDNLVGSRLTIIKTFEQFLDDGSNPDPTATFPEEIFSIDQLVSMDNERIVWRLAALFDVRGVKLPRRQILRDACTHRYRRFVNGSFDYTKATCPYVGSSSFDLQNNATNSANDKCALNLGACRLRFGSNAVLPFRGFPGAARIRDRV